MLSRMDSLLIAVYFVCFSVLSLFGSRVTNVQTCLLSLLGSVCGVYIFSALGSGYVCPSFDVFVAVTYFSALDSGCMCKRARIERRRQQTKTSLKKWIHTVSKFIDLIQFLVISQMLAKFSGVESERIVSKFSKRETKGLICVYLLHKAGAWN